MEQFIIKVQNEKTRRVHRVAVIIIYRSAQVIRFTISGKDGRYIKAEKLLFRKHHSWKLISQNFRTDPKDKIIHGKTMTNIIQAIEYHLKGPQRPRIHPKNDFDIIGEY